MDGEMISHMGISNVATTVLEKELAKKHDDKDLAMDMFADFTRRQCVYESFYRAGSKGVFYQKLLVSSQQEEQEFPSFGGRNA